MHRMKVQTGKKSWKSKVFDRKLGEIHFFTVICFLILGKQYSNSQCLLYLSNILGTVIQNAYPATIIQEATLKTYKVVEPPLALYHLTLVGSKEQLGEQLAPGESLTPLPPRPLSARLPPWLQTPSIDRGAWAFLKVRGWGMFTFLIHKSLYF